MSLVVAITVAVTLGALIAVGIPLALVTPAAWTAFAVFGYK